jgi:muramoyltetrapeptide carboxypeptidase
MIPMLIPKKLPPGGVIGIIAPAGPIADAAKVDSGARYLESLGYRVLLGKHLFERSGYLAGTDAGRAEDVNVMFSNKHVRAILCARGGYGSVRLLPLLNFPLIRRHPKILVGFSDVTSLQLALWKKCRLVTFHGPMLISDFSGLIHPSTEESFWRMVTSSRLPAPVKLTGTVLRKGTAIGRILGGNMSLVASLAGTPYFPDFKGSLLFLEEIGEEPYRVDRMARQLSGAGVLGGAAGLIAGQFTDCAPEKPSSIPADCSLVIAEAAREIAGPVIAGAAFGHVAEKITLPVGMRATLDAARMELRLSSASVS